MCATLAKRARRRRTGAALRERAARSGCSVEIELAIASTGSPWVRRNVASSCRCVGAAMAKGQVWALAR